jgi:hypothetical protein
MIVHMHALVHRAVLVPPRRLREDLAGVDQAGFASRA